MMLELGKVGSARVAMALETQAQWKILSPAAVRGL